MVARATKVADASALAAVAFRESPALEIRGQLAGAELLAPPLLPAELTNIAWKKCRRQPTSAEAVSEQLTQILSVPVTLVHVDHTEVLHLALLWGLTAYDASYLWVAWRRRVALVTLDRRLAAVAVEMGLS